ncbi:MAG TPA: phosphoenolpyruvate kinase [Myxococcales bacterium]|jgi:citrate lyase beta subunit|nr:phosphoenolpyruvate kinase [Myxococcales bacterium]
MATTSLEGSTLRQITARLKAAQDIVLRHYPGEAGQRQPVHTVYGGAHLFKSDTVRKLGELALEALSRYAPSATVFADAIGVDPGIAETVFTRVREKLRREAVEDYRLDFEDGYGNRADSEEDGHASQAAAETAKGFRNGTLSPFIGIRIKTLSGELGPRALRTLDIYLTALVRETGGKLPANFVVTLPKITSPAQVTALIDAFEALEPALGLQAGSLKMEPMIEMTQSILDQDGASMLPKILRAARGRMVAAHFGTYDYTASCNITAAYQHMRHAACDFAKHMMQVAYAGTGIWLSDGATGILPVPVHRGDALTDAQKRDNQRAVHAAWRLHADDTRHSLANGYYQGWDLHPAQLPCRYGAAYGFFLKGLPAASERLKNFVGKAAQATLVGDVFDDAATGQGLLNFFLRGVNCGALLEEEALATGLTLEELRGRSFLKILNNRRAAAEKP